MDLIELREYFRKRGIPQKEIAEKLDVSPQYVSSLLHGRVPLGKGTATKLENAFGLNAQYLLMGVGQIDSKEPSNEEKIERLEQELEFYKKQVAVLQKAILDR